MWVLVTIYHRLLRHIEQRNFDVFLPGLAFPAYEKLSILEPAFSRPWRRGYGPEGLRTSL